MTVPTTSTAQAATVTSRAPLTLVLTALFVALVVRQVFALWERFDLGLDYDRTQELGEAYWPMNLFVFGPAYAIGFALQAFLTWPLARGRGRVLTWIGAVLLLIGGTLFALVATAHALPFDWAANHGILDETTGRDVFDAFAAIGTGAQLWPYLLATQAVIALGGLLTAIGGRRSGTVPTWALVLVVLLVAAFAVPLPPAPFLGTLLSFAQAVMWAILGWFGWRAGRQD